MRALISDTGVLASLAVAISLVLAGLAVPSLRLWRATGGVIAMVAIAGGLVASDGSFERYNVVGTRWYSTRILAAIVVLVLVVGLIRLAVWAQASLMISVEVSAAVAGASLGIFLCVPETDLLRLVPAALALPTVAMLAGRLRPFGPLAVALISSGLGWMIVIDGVARGSAAVGALACLAAPLLLPLAHGWRLDRRGPSRTTGSFATWHLVVLGTVILGCSRIAGLRASAELAIVWAAAFLLVGAIALWRLESRVQNSSIVPSGS